jgi:hypothetical protein
MARLLARLGVPPSWSEIFRRTWLYISGLAILAGAEMNAEIEHASPYGKDKG